MQTIKLKLKKSQIETLDSYIKTFIKNTPYDNDEKLLIATLAQIGRLTDAKLGAYMPIQKEYKVTLNVAQMVALVIISKDYEPDVGSYLGVLLLNTRLQIEKIINN